MLNEPYCEQQESPIFLQAVETALSEREKQNITGGAAEKHVVNRAGGYLYPKTQKWNN